MYISTLTCRQRVTHKLVNDGPERNAMTDLNDCLGRTPRHWTELRPGVYAQLYAHIICWFSIQIQECHSGQLESTMTNLTFSPINGEHIFVTNGTWFLFFFIFFHFFIFIFLGGTIIIIEIAEYKYPFNILLCWFIIITYFQVVEWLQLICPWFCSERVLVYNISIGLGRWQVSRNSQKGVLSNVIIILCHIMTCACGAWAMSVGVCVKWHGASCLSSVVAAVLRETHGWFI